MKHIETRVDPSRRPVGCLAAPGRRGVDGKLEPHVGERLQVRIAPVGGRPMTFKPRVTVVDPGRRLEWLGTMGIPGLFDGRHSFTLTPVGNGRTRLVQAEDFFGALVPFTGRVLSRTEAGFRAMNAALLTRLEMASMGDATGTQPN